MNKTLKGAAIYGVKFGYLLEVGGSAYRIRTGDLLLEREVSLTPSRMRQTTESTRNQRNYVTDSCHLILVPKVGKHFRPTITPSVILSVVHCPVQGCELEVAY